MENAFSNSSGGAYTSTTGTLNGLWMQGFQHVGVVDNFVVTDARQIYVEDLKGNMGGAAEAKYQITTDAGIWVDKQQLGDTNNYGLVLNGDGAGADIVLGDAQQTKLSNNSTADEATFTGVGGLKIPSFTYATLPAACTEGAIVIVTDDDDCITSASGDGALCVCTNATNTWTVLKDY